MAKKSTRASKLDANAGPNDRPQLPSPQVGRRSQIPNGLLLASSAAIVSLYALGYVHTRAAGPPDTTASASVAATTSAFSAPTATGRTTLTTPAPGSSSSQASGAKKDGTYVGLGTSRHGDIEATVVIKGGAIVSASVSSCMTRYACSDVDPLVREMVAKQVVPVDHVSGATDSSTAYKQAVAKALAKSTQG